MAAPQRVTVEPGVQACHSRACATARGRKCNCKPTHQAWVHDPRSGKRIYHRCATRAEARAWRQDALVGLRKGTVRAPSRTTLPEAAEAWLEGARDGSIRNRSGDRYKPSAIRGYERSLRLRILPNLGHLRMSEVRRRDVQDFADRLYAKGLDPSTIKNTLNPLQAIYRRAVNRDEVAINPTTGLELAAARGSRERIPHQRRPPSSSPPSLKGTGRYGRPPSTLACAAASYARSSGQTSTSRNG